MSSLFKYNVVGANKSRTLNLFVHGYSAGQSLEDRLLLAKSIPATLDNAVNVFCYWNATDVARVGWLSGLKNNAAAMVGPGALAASLAVDRGAHFIKARASVKRHATRFFVELARFIEARGLEIDVVNLVGHSLGARLLVLALLDQCKYKLAMPFDLGEVVFMAGAVELKPGEAEKIKTLVTQRVLNLYSSSDYALLMNVGESSMGRGPVEGFENHLLEGFGHTDYWPNLSLVLKRVGFCNFEGKSHPALYGQASLPIKIDKLANDYMLSDVLEYANAAVRSEVVGYLSSKYSVSIKADETSHLAITEEIQRLGGNTFANAVRRGGVRYCEILEDCAGVLGIRARALECLSVSQLERLIVTQLVDEYGKADPPLQQRLMSKLQQPASQSVHIVQANYLAMVRIVSESISMLKSFMSSMTDDGVLAQEQTLPAIAKGAMAIALGKSGFRFVASKANVALAIATVGSLVVGGVAGPAYRVLLPVVMLVHLARIQSGNKGLH